MKKYTTTLTGDLEPNESGEVYLASEVDARIAELRAGLLEALEWNWMDADCPQDIRQRLIKLAE